MANFNYVFLGKETNPFAYHQLEVTLAELSGPGFAVTSCKLEKLQTGEILYTLSSDEPFQVQLMKMQIRFLQLIADPLFVYSDLYMSEAKGEKYFICINTKVLLPGRNPKDDALLDDVWMALGNYDVNIDIGFSVGYLTLTIDSINPLSEEVRSAIKNAIDGIYPDSIVFEYPNLPKE